MSASQALQLVARACIQEIQAQEPILRRTRSPEALHQIRVALRRWRTALSVFGAAGGEDRTRTTLKWLSRELNEARDLDVFADAFAARRAGGAGEDLLWETGHTGLQAPPRADDGPSARKAAAKALEHRWGKLKRRGRKLMGMDGEARHRLRIQAKKVRYTTELCGELFGHAKRQARMGKALKGMQDSLGVLNDLVVGETVALKLARRASSLEAAFAAGMLIGTRACEEQKPVLKSARKAYLDFAAVDRFWRGAAG